MTSSQFTQLKKSGTITDRISNVTPINLTLDPSKMIDCRSWSAANNCTDGSFIILKGNK
jgi:hypothetical protein